MKKLLSNRNQFLDLLYVDKGKPFMGGGDIGHLKIEDEASWTITIEERKSPYFQSPGNKGKNTLL
ncbi:hypothetical protein [Enterocloster citroniae]|uniref:hypothetical protein n=1 Tax=Enterocloster citroniae TaxID=358743 RepID=UPI00058F13E0|nr:hypothetical protein [Enterocloster citroniae]MCC3383605.1 hypothetical protein [Enterocloster citroniae]